MARPPALPRGLPRPIWILGFVSMFMDISSEMIHALLPVFLVTVLGASALSVGIIEGIAEATASITKVFSGAISDWVGKRKALAALGYGLAALTKPVFPLAEGVGVLVAARFVDRIGKGIRGAPRDALVADLAPADLRGSAFGLRQSLDTVGAFIGPFLAMGLMWLSANDYRLVFWVAVIPAFLAFGLILFGVQEPERRETGSKPPLRLADAVRMSRGFWVATGIAAVLTLARFSEAFLILRAQGLGFPPAAAPLVLVVMNIVYAAAAYPAGALSDRLGRRGILAAGIALLVLSDLVLAAASGPATVLVGVALWGLHMGFTQGLLASLVADTAPPALRGTAFGLFNLVGGVAVLAASVLAGALWDSFGPATTFLAGAAFAALSLVALALRPTPSA